MNLSPQAAGPAFGHRLAAARAALLACWSLPGADTALRQRLLNLQARSIPINAWMGELLVLAVALGVVLIDPQPPGWWPLWVGAIALNHLVMRRFRQRPMQDDGPVPAYSLRTAVLDRLVLGLVFGAGMAWLYRQGDDTLRLAVVTGLIGTMSGAALRYARIPPVAGTWIAVLALTMALALVSVGRPVDGLLLGSLLAYAVVLLGIVLGLSRQFVVACAREFEAERQAQLLQLLLADVEDASRDWFFECDARGRLCHASPRLAALAGQTAEALQGQDLAQVLAGLGAPPQPLAQVSQRLAEGRPFRDQVVALAPAGQPPQWWALSAKPLLDLNSRLTGWRGVGLDVTAARQHEQALAHMALTDALTGLASRHGLARWLGARQGPDGLLQPTQMLLLDLDRFKVVNDAHGHGVGDQLLQAVGQRLAGCCREGELLARLGGDEFVLVVPGEAAGHDGLRQRAEQLLQALRPPFLLGPLRFEVRASLGAGAAPIDACTAADLQRAADIALYAAKSAGRGTLRLYDATIGEQARQRGLLTQDLAQALARGQLHLVYQLSVDSGSGQPTGAEALLRWTHPTHGEIAPGAFVPLAEETGLIVPIGLWVLRLACQDALTWPRPLPVAVNLSAAQLRSRGFVQDVARILADTGLPPHRLELELTESTLAERETDVAEALSALRALGTRLALDDFGTGASSLARLQRHGFDRLKIDRAFVSPLTDGANDRAALLVRAILDLAQALGMASTAEGVEHEAQARTLRQLGCKTLQGFRYHRPAGSQALAQAIGAGGHLAA